MTAYQMTDYMREHSVMQSGTNNGMTYTWVCGFRRSDDSERHKRVPHRSYPRKLRSHRSPAAGSFWADGERRRDGWCPEQFPAQCFSRSEPPSTTLVCKDLQLLSKRDCYVIACTEPYKFDLLFFGQNDDYTNTILRYCSDCSCRLNATARNS